MRKNWSKILVCKLGEDGYAEQPATPHVAHGMGAKDRDFELRLIDWGNVVNPINTGRGQASTFWAARYYEIRNSAFRRELIQRGIIEQKTLLQKIEDQAAAELRYQDALQIESAWAKLGDLTQKQVLLMRYVERHKEEYIRSRLRLRGRQNLALILWRAKFSMKQILACEKNTAIIRSDNLNSFAG